MVTAFQGASTSTSTRSTCTQQQQHQFQHSMYPASKPSPSSPAAAPASFSFGVIADVQWADIDDGYNYMKTVKRCYRGSFQTLCAAVEYWNAFNTRQRPSGTTTMTTAPPSSSSLAFIAQLGDLIDGVNQKLGQSEAALHKALHELNSVTAEDPAGGTQEARKTRIPAVNIIGNHELYNFDRHYLHTANWLRHGDKEYYSFRPVPGWKMIVLDPYQISLLGYDTDQTDPRYVAALEVLTHENPNCVPTNDTGANWFDGIDPDKPYQRRFVPYNGGFGPDQLTWFRQEVQQSRAAQERVIVLSHVILHPQACGGGTMAWDYEQALAIIHDVNTNTSNAADADADTDTDTTEDATTTNTQDQVVVAVLCGHDHKGNYYYDDLAQVHHCTFISPLNKGTEGKAYGMIHVSNTQLEIIGPKVNDLLPFVNNRPVAASKQTSDDNQDIDADEVIVLPFGRRTAPRRQQEQYASSEIEEPC